MRAKGNVQCAEKKFQQKLKFVHIVEVILANAMINKHQLYTKAALWVNRGLVETLSIRIP